MASLQSAKDNKLKRRKIDSMHLTPEKSGLGVSSLGRNLNDVVNLDPNQVYFEIPEEDEE